jgi:hypothetical protein
VTPPIDRTEGETADQPGALRDDMRLPQNEINQLRRQLFVTKEKVLAHEHEVSERQYRLLVRDDNLHQEPTVTLQGLTELNRSAATVAVLRKNAVG